MQELSDKVTSWPKFFNLAHQHGVLPLVYQTLKSHRINIPQPAIAMLTQLHTQHVMHHMQMVAELQKIIKVFENANIKLVAIKGPILSMIAYGDVLSRQYLDLDFLVSEANISSAAILLESEGYIFDKPTEFLHNNALLRAGKDVSCYNPKNGVKIELHWRLFERRLLKHNENDILHTLQQLKFENNNIHALCNEPQFLYLCIHGSKHYWERLEWVADIDRLVRYNDLNWEQLQQMTKTLHVNTMLLLGLGMARRFFDTPLPIALLKRITENTKVLHLIEKICSNMLNTIQMEVGDASEHMRRIASLADTRCDAWIQALRLAFSLKTGDVYTINLPQSLHGLYYLIRPFRLGYGLIADKTHRHLN